MRTAVGLMRNVYSNESVLAYSIEMKMRLWLRTKFYFSIKQALNGTWNLFPLVFNDSFV